MNEQDRSRAKMLGVLIRDARLHAGRSVEDCAQALGINQESYSQIEHGELNISLPALEVLAMHLDVPMAHFWGSHTLDDIKKPDYRMLLALRHKIVGSLLRQARLEAGRTPEELAETLEVDVAQIHSYEQGDVEVPYIHLEKMAGRLRVPMAYFVEEDHGPLARHEARQKRLHHFNLLPHEMQDFVSQPANAPYLEAAMRLSEMDVSQLRDLAAGLLDITF